MEFALGFCVVPRLQRGTLNRDPLNRGTLDRGEKGSPARRNAPLAAPVPGIGQELGIRSG